MNSNLLLLEMHWMNGNCGNMVFKNINRNEVYKIKRLKNALQFVAMIVQQCLAYEGGAERSSPVAIDEIDQRNKWIFQSSFAEGVVRVALLSHKAELLPTLSMMFYWEGTLNDFSNSVNRFIAKLPCYSFFDRLAALKRQMFGSVCVGHLVM